MANGTAQSPALDASSWSPRDAVWAVEDRLLPAAAETARGAFDAVRWPFERLAWGVERRLIWPVQEWIAGWDQRQRAAGTVAVAAVAIGAVALGLTLATGSGGTSSSELATAPSTPPTAPKAPPAKSTPAAPVLQGVPPVFKAGAGLGAAKATGGAAKASAGADSGIGAPPAAVGSGEPAGPAALKVAHRFADAFALYEIGQGGSEARTAFRATATPELARSLMRRPPRLPANVKVPKAKVVNVVAAPSHGGVFPVSVSLLRVGVTSELRLDMQKQGKGASGKGKPPAGKGHRDQNIWLVTEITG